MKNFFFALFLISAAVGVAVIPSPVSATHCGTTIGCVETPVTTPAPIPQIQTPAPQPATPKLDELTDLPSLSGGNANTGGGKGKPATASDIAQEVQCGGSSSGGALQDALGNLGDRLGDAAISGIASGLRSQGPAGRAASEIIRGRSIGDAVGSLSTSVVRGLGDAAGGAIQNQVAGACGDSSLGRRICNRVGSALGNYVEGAVQQYGGQVVQQGLKNLGVSQLGGLFGKSGGILGGVAGMFGVVGSKVPTTDETAQQLIDQVRQLDTGILEKNSIIVNKECDGDPTVAALMRQVKNQVTSKILEKAAEQQVTDVHEDLHQASLAGKREYIDSISNPELRAYAEKVVTEEESGGNTQVPDCGTTEIEKIWNKATQPTKCSPSYAKTYSDLQEAGKQAQDTYRAALETDYKPVGQCPDGTTDVSKCPTQFKIALPGKDVGEASRKAQSQILEIDVDEIGEATGNLVADIFDEITTVFADEAESGLRRLISNRGSGSSGGGSYLNRLANGEGTPTADQGRQYLTRNITDSLSIEAQYQNVQTNTATALRGLIAVFEDIQACYLGYADQPPAGLTRESALAAAENASTTIRSILEPQLTAAETNFRNSQSAVRDLGVLLDRARVQNDATSINATADTYDSLRNGSRTRTAAELQFATEDMARLVPALSLAEEDARSQLEDCQNYGVSATPPSI